MIDKERIIAAVKEPMAQYCETMRTTIGDWQPLLKVSEKILAGAEVRNNDVQPELQFLVEWMRLIMEVTRDGQWDWTSPAVQAVYKNYADSMIYKTFAVATVGIVIALLKTGLVGTVLEIGTGPGQVSEALCKKMTEENLSVPLIISDRAPAIASVGENLRKNFPALSIADFVWDIRKAPPEGLVEKLDGPVLLFERFCIPYGGYEAIDRVAPVADIMLMVEDLNLTGKKEAYDVIYEKIGLQFFTFQEARKYLEKHFSFIHTCDRETIDAINLPVTDFTLLIK
jgi:hypothetical protein